MQEWKKHNDNKMSNNHHTIRGWLLRVWVQAFCFTNSRGPLCTWSQGAIIKCLCLKVQESFFATNKLWCLGSASRYFPRFPKCGSGKIGCVTGSYMIQVLSIGTSVSRIGFYGSNQEKLWWLTHIESLRLASQFVLILERVHLII